MFPIVAACIVLTGLPSAADLPPRTTDAARPPTLQAVPFTTVSIADEFWTPRLKTIRERTLRHVFRKCEETGRISNFDKAAGRTAGAHEGYFFNDSDVYKNIEAAAYALALQPDPELDRYLDDLIARIVAAQQPDGYLNTFYTLDKTNPPWSNLKDKHELYCAGHLIEAAVAHHQATGKRTLLDAAIRFADLIDSIFGPGRRADVCGHEEIELALIKLWRLTGEEKYLRLARFFLEQRGVHTTRPSYGEYCQDHVPAREHTEIVGHAVRAMYLYCALADAAAVDGDPGYIAAMDRIWTDLVEKKTYITGGIGPSAHNEGFTEPYDLPNDTAYAETCAAIGTIFWNHRLNLLHADARYVDAFERALYNGVLSGVALEGESYNYTNPLAGRGQHHRQDWFTCACCPPNITRLFLALGGYIYAHTADTVYVNLFVGSTARVSLGETKVTLEQSTRYPWDGQVRLTLRPEKPALFEVAVRVPAWCREAAVVINGKPISDPDVHQGYFRHKRKWEKGNTIELSLPMPVERIEAHPRVRSDVGRVALQRGPLVYCLEGVDNGAKVRHLALPRQAELRAIHQPELLGGVTTVTGQALAQRQEDWRDWTGRLYRPSLAVEPVAFTAVPYYAWDNRAAGEMVVWLPEAAGLVEPPPVTGLRVTSSHMHSADTPLALYDRVEPISSQDNGLPRFSWWSHRGTAEWVAYDFDRARRVSSVAVYWFDDQREGGLCRVPASWRLLYRVGEDWKEVADHGAYATELNQFNRVNFSPIEAEALKIEVQLQPEFSAGILEWKVE